MKNVDEFVRNNNFYNRTFSELLANYKEANKKIEDCLARKEEYDELIESDTINKDSDELSIKEQWELYSIVDNLIRKSSSGYQYLGIDLIELRNRLEKVYPELREYLKIKYELKDFRNWKHKILAEDISFDKFHHVEQCWNGHSFVNIDGELKCMCCGATTKDYPLNDEEVEFLTLCAESQGMFLKNVTKDDLPLLQVLMEKQAYEISLKKPLDFDDEDYFDEVEEEYLADEAQLAELMVDINKAHLLDKKIYKSDEIEIRDPALFTPDDKEKYLAEIDKELERINNSNSRFKDFMIEECKTARYEVLILSGEHIPTLVEQAKDEDDKSALTKAYYNISNQDFRMNSGYFGTRFDMIDRYAALRYDCITANPEINSRILQMRYRR